MRISLITCLVLFSTRASAQQTAPPSIQWWHVAVATGLLVVTSAVDYDVKDWIQTHRSSGADAAARVFRHGGQPEVVFAVPAGMFVAGLIGHDKKLERGALRVIASVGAAGLTTVAIKEVVGRVRPISATNQYEFRPFTQDESFPSGHTTVAFAFAAALGDEIHRPWASALLYAGATGTAWSRLNDNEHWLSDVLAGAAVGITAAKIVDGRWRLFGLRPPRFLVEPQERRARVEWRATF
ncbi:MAG TPA: phosphatase PAP2 family protein [Gemmatimonadales bacterium]|nr:phosphatase PAP2 family protein [Gemmatimonadales bacterium]